MRYSHRNRNHWDLMENSDSDHRSYENLIYDKDGILFQ